MQPHDPTVHDPVAIKPLLRAIAQEIRERSGAVRSLEERLDALSAAGEATGAQNERLELRAQLAEHRLALRLARKELDGFGWTLEEGKTPLLVMRTGGGIERLAWKPEQTGFYPNANGAGL